MAHGHMGNNRRLLDVDGMAGSGRELMDVTWPELIKMADDVISKGGMCFIKFTCRHCGARQTFDKPNTIYASGSCEDCGQTTNILEHGGGMIVLFPIGGNRDQAHRQD